MLGFGVVEGAGVVDVPGVMVGVKVVVIIGVRVGVGILQVTGGLFSSFPLPHSLAAVTLQT